MVLGGVLGLVDMVGVAPYSEMSPATTREMPATTLSWLVFVWLYVFFFGGHQGGLFAGQEPPF